MSTARIAARRALRDALGAFPTGVAVVTARSAEGLPVGVTVNSFASLSLEPPLVLWSLNLKSPSLAIFEQASHFAVNVLSAEQAHLSRRFATPAPDKFDGLEVSEGAGGAPVLAGTAACFECRTEARYPGGDHRLFIGHVEHYSHDKTRAPLLFHRGRYREAGEHLS